MLTKAVCRNFAKGGRGGANLGYLKKGGAATSSVRGSTGRQCLKNSLIILRAAPALLNTPPC